MQSVFNQVKGKALNVAEYLTPVLKVDNQSDYSDKEDFHI